MKLVEYIHSNTFKDNYKISSNGELFFHWANWRETCKIQKDLLGKGVDQIDFIDNTLESLKTKSVWFQRNLKSVKSNLYELYEAYLDPRLKATWHDIQKDTLVSLHHEAGPYISLTSMRWMDKSTYSFFVYRKLLTGYFPLREFRLSANIELIAEVNHSPLNSIKTKITQFSNRGLILSIDGHSFSKVKNSENISIKINLKSFKSSKTFNCLKNFDANHEEANDYMHIKGSSFRNSGNLNNADYSNGSEYYFFIPYSEISFVNRNEGAAEVFGRMVSLAEEGLREEISKISIVSESALEVA
ncbi:hypothetical protein [Halobacteriovorax sp. JY17]|uniref:hypothetical protein n=1 Tax=Halobacteriovorax sp. JY17 TaxID=2014617 RepID=UPI000C3DFBA3|nr:hypothetical protein [Halobacteriovorax sp. JY17]PIK16290.1 MAG: hypothetical protein CES88_06005 [Halobacteriovorax sp. JY17]